MGKVGRIVCMIGGIIDVAEPTGADTLCVAVGVGVIVGVFVAVFVGCGVGVRTTVTSTVTRTVAGGCVGTGVGSTVAVGVGVPPNRLQPETTIAISTSMSDQRFIFNLHQLVNTARFQHIFDRCICQSQGLFRPVAFLTALTIPL